MWTIVQVTSECRHGNTMILWMPSRMMVSLRMHSSNLKNYMKISLSIWLPCHWWPFLLLGLEINGSLVTIIFNLGRVHRGIGQARLNLIGMAIFYPAAVMWLVSRPVPRKLYTDIITDTSADGTYVREALKQRKPGLWQKISSQLY